MPSPDPNDLLSLPISLRFSGAFGILLQKLGLEAGEELRMANWRHQGVYLCHTWNRRRTRTNNSPCNDRSSRAAATQTEDSFIKQWPATCQGSYQGKEVWNGKAIILKNTTRQTLHDEPKGIEKTKELWDIDVSDESKPSCVQENSSPRSVSHWRGYWGVHTSCHWRGYWGVHTSAIALAPP